MPEPAAASPIVSAPAPRYFDSLNDSQRAAVEAVDGPVLVLAGAGTGKTRVLTTRLAHILMSGRAHPGQVLAVTFTNKAAREMKDRVSALISRPVEGWWLGTFHSLAARLLRRHAELVGFKPNFTILDTDDQIRLLKQLIQATNIDDKKWPARALLGVIERWKDRGLTPDKVSAAEQGDFAHGRVLELYRAYQERLRTLNACDFGDLLLHNLTLFAGNADVLQSYQRQFKYILVDEYQDTNVAQYLWLRLLAQQHRNLCCVGDDDQSIYGWRGAEVGNILRFEKDFPGARIIRLERNYRSTHHILGAASGLIAHNQGRLGKTLWTESNEGDRVSVRGLWDGEEEARFVGDEVEAFQRKGVKLGQIAILVRAGFQTREFEERFIVLGVPYRVIGGPRFYERQEIRDAIAYLRIVHQSDDDLAFERIVNTPRRGIGDSSIRAIHSLARQQGVSMSEAAARLIETDELKPAARKAIGTLLRDFERWRNLSAGMPPGEFAEIVLDESGYTAMWQADKSPEAPGRLENLKELVTAMDEFENLAGFLEHVSLVMESAEGEPGDMVNIMTLHSAKGLEFDVVFLPGWEEGLFPNQRALDETGAAGLEEERRLAYVGLTRARHRAIVCYAANRRVHNMWQSALPSRFVGELPREHAEHASDVVGSEATGADSSAGFSEGGEAFAANWRPRRSWSARPVEAPPRPMSRESGITYREGARIFHQKFGYGSVEAVEGDKLDIAFDKAGAKKVLASFVVPADRAR
ncbi:MAG TPA: UvrD-helicase domain-containing protein [Methylomirabilota bacterium]|nr:UvrD-helicase domain-containing protein [Methylomirabilota bacterium]